MSTDNKDSKDNLIPKKSLESLKSVGVFPRDRMDTNGICMKRACLTRGRLLS